MINYLNRYCKSRKKLDKVWFNILIYDEKRHVTFRSYFL